MYIINIIVIYIGCSISNSEMERKRYKTISIQDKGVKKNTHLAFSMTFIFDIIISADEKCAAIYLFFFIIIFILSIMFEVSLILIHFQILFLENFFI